MNIRNFFNKTAVLFLFFISISVVLTLGFSVIKTLLSDSNTDYRTDGGAIASIESENGEGLTNKQLREFIKKLDYPIIITESGENKGLFVFCSDETTASFDVEGRSFYSHELEKSVNGALISEKVKNQCYERNAKKYISFDGLEYEVIGIYDKSSSNISYYTSLLYRLERMPDEQINSVNFYGENRKKCAAEFKEYISSKFTDGSVETEVFITDEISADDGSMFYIVLALLVIFLLLNLSTVIQMWLHSKNKEIFVRTMSGADPARILGRLIFNFVVILVLSFVIGSGISCALIAVGIFKPIITAVDLTGMLIGFSAFLLFGIVYAYLLISNKISKELAEVKR